MKYLLLVVSILSVVAAQYMYDQDEENRLEAYRRVLQRLRARAQMQAVETERERAMNAMNAVVKKKCEENGPAGAYENLEREIEEFQSCLQQALASTPRPQYGGIRESVRYACRLAPQIGSCVIRLGNAAKPCLPPQRRANFLLPNITNTIINYGCDNEGARIHDFIVGDGPMCFRSQAEELKQCTAQYETDEVVNSLENSIESGEVTESNCKKSDELRKCMEGKLQSCSTSAAEDFFKGLFDALEKFDPCERVQRNAGRVIIIR